MEQQDIIIPAFTFKPNVFMNNLFIYDPDLYYEYMDNKTEDIECEIIDNKEEIRPIGLKSPENLNL